MLKQTINYEDIDEQPASATLWFNLTQLEITKDMELEVLEARFIKFQEEVFNSGETRKLTPAEIRELYRMLEVLVKAAYGKRYGPDNKLFSKDPQVWQEFNDSGQYDGFMRWLFNEDDNQGIRANTFFENIWPKDVREAWQNEQRKENVKLVKDAEVKSVSLDAEPNPFGGEVSVVAPDAPDDTPSITDLVEERGLGQMSDGEILSLSDSAFERLVERSTQGNNVPGRLLVLGMKRGPKGTTE